MNWPSMDSFVDHFASLGGKQPLLLATAALSLFVFAVLYWSRLGNRRLALKCLVIAALLHMLIGGVSHEYHLFLKGRSEQTPVIEPEVRVPIQLSPTTPEIPSDRPITPLEDPRQSAIAIESPSETIQKELQADPLKIQRPPIGEMPLPPIASLPDTEDPIPETPLPLAQEKAEPTADSDPSLIVVPEAPLLEESIAAPALPTVDGPSMTRRTPNEQTLPQRNTRPQRPSLEPVPPAAPEMDAPKNSQDAIDPPELALADRVSTENNDIPFDPIALPSLPKETPTELSEEPADSAGLLIRPDDSSSVGRRRQMATGDLPKRRPATTGTSSATDASATPSLAKLTPLPPLGSDVNGGAGVIANEMTAVWRNRLAPDRMNIVQRFGGSLQTEQAVADALTWLAAHQSAQGNWDCDHFFDRCPAGDKCDGPAVEVGSDAGVTALALLTFLGAGHTHKESSRYRENVERGLRWLRSIQRPDGDLRLSGRIYCHSMATLCLCEAYAMTKDEELKVAAQKGIDWLSRAQHMQSGGWRYGPGQFGDTSVYGWAVLSLRSARNAGLRVSEQTWVRSQRWLTLVSSGAQGGLACYRPGTEPTHAMTAEALVCRQIFGLPRTDPGMAEAGDYLLSRLPATDDYHLYYWYYGTLAMFQLGGDHWNRWNQTLTNTLLATQNKTGHQRGSWDPLTPFGIDGGRVFSTACSALCLEVYYRYLPLYSTSGTPTAEAHFPPPTIRN